MRIDSVTLSGFRSFGPEPVVVDLANDLTTIVGPNASGKTALLQGLSKLFGVTKAQRTVQKSDFHLPPDVEPNDRTTRDLYIPDSKDVAEVGLRPVEACETRWDEADARVLGQKHPSQNCFPCVGTYNAGILGGTNRGWG